MIRKYSPKDDDYIEKAFISEGFDLKEMVFRNSNTYITDEGFFSYRIDNGYPRLLHYYVNKNLRPSYKASLRLLRAFVELIRKDNYLFFTVVVPKEKPYLKKMIEFVRGKQYCKINGDVCYYVPVFGRIR